LEVISAPGQSIRTSRALVTHFVVLVMIAFRGVLDHWMYAVEFVSDKLTRISMPNGIEIGSAQSETKDSPPPSSPVIQNPMTDFVPPCDLVEYH